jgi:aspartate kinase
VAGIAGEKGFCSININKYMMNREIGFGRKVLQILEEEFVPFEHMPSGIDDISIIVRKKYLDADKKSRIMERIAKELKVDSVNIEYDLGLVMVVGEGMKCTVGITSRISKALSLNDVNIRMINQGSSEVSIMFGVCEDDVDKAWFVYMTSFSIKPLKPVLLMQGRLFSHSGICSMEGVDRYDCCIKAWVY